MGYTAQLPVPVWPRLACLPAQEIYYAEPDPAAWKDSHSRRDYRRSRMDRHRRYMQALPWSRTMLGADIRERANVGRCSAEQAWLLDEELTRRFAHERSRWGICHCEREFWGGERWWWPFPEDEWEPHREDGLCATGMFSSHRTG